MGRHGQLRDYQTQPRQGVLTRDCVAGPIYGNFQHDEVHEGRCTNIPKSVFLASTAPPWTTLP